MSAYDVLSCEWIEKLIEDDEDEEYDVNKGYNQHYVSQVFP